MKRIALPCALVASLASCTVNGASWPGTSTSRGGGSEPTASASGAAPASSATPSTVGGNCTAETLAYLRESGHPLDPCWDPPGSRSYAPPVHIEPGRRSPATDIYWFDMPREGRRDDACVQVPGTMDSWLPYEPYAEDGGGTPPVLPDFAGVPLETVLDQLDALDLPLCAKVVWDDGCTQPHGMVCDQAPELGDPVYPDGRIQLRVGVDIKHQGTADEQRRFPDLLQRPTAEAVAELERRGFTSVTVVEEDLTCERGIVCATTPWRAGFYPPSTPITLKVRRAKRGN